MSLASNRPEWHLAGGLIVAFASWLEKAVRFVARMIRAATGRQ